MFWTNSESGSETRICFPASHLRKTYLRASPTPSSWTLTQEAFNKYQLLRGCAAVAVIHFPESGGWGNWFDVRAVPEKAREGNYLWKVVFLGEWSQRNWAEFFHRIGLETLAYLTTAPRRHVTLTQSQNIGRLSTICCAFVDEPGFLHVSYVLFDNWTTFCFTHWENCSSISKDCCSEVDKLLIGICPEFLVHANSGFLTSSLIHQSISEDLPNSDLPYLSRTGSHSLS